MKRSLLFFTYWYPDRNNHTSGIFIKRHAITLALNNRVVVLAFRIAYGKTIFRSSREVFHRDGEPETHIIYWHSVFYKLLYVLLSLHSRVLSRYISENILTKHRPQVLHSNILFPCAVVGHRLATKFGLKHVITEHWSKIDKFFRVSLYRGAGKEALDKASAISCVSKTLADIVRKHTVNSRLHIIPNVIDHHVFKYVGSSARNAKTTYLAVAHWTPPKNPFYFIEALKLLSRETGFAPFKLVIVGEGPLVAQMRLSATGLDADFIAKADPEGLAALMNQCHFFLHGSDFETFSVVIPEALSCGLPCIASPVGIAPELINGNNGFIAKNDVGDWMAKINKAGMMEYNRSQISQEMRTRFDPASVAALFEKMYTGCV